LPLVQHHLRQWVAAKEEEDLQSKGNSGNPAPAKEKAKEKSKEKAKETATEKANAKAKATGKAKAEGGSSGTASRKRGSGTSFGPCSTT